MNIRCMTANDYDDVYKLWLETPGMGLNTTDDSRQGIEAYLRRNPTTCFVALDGEKLVGAIIAGHDGRRGYIYHTAVAMSHRKAGIATTLVDRAMDALQREGIHKAALVVFARNELGNGFWEHRGFTRRDDLIYRNKNNTELTRIDT